MGFKSDREFLRNVSIGAIGTRKIATILRAGGFQVIELERYCSNNKIWATKIKRLRVPDLLCLKSGIRIECRAKANLKITMSHSVNNTDRAWDQGLRDNDLVAFIRVWPADDSWVASERLALFRVGDMRSAWSLAKREAMKAASQGSEFQVTWPAVVPNKAGTVVSVSSDTIKTVLSNGRRQSYRLSRQSNGEEFTLTSHVTVGDTFGDGDTILASAMPGLVSPIVPEGRRYDFFRDLKGGTAETVYVGVKALGFLPELAAKSRKPLCRIMESSEDGRIQLEAAASLARLGCEEGWNSISRIATNTDMPSELRMESTLILPELPDHRSLDLLKAWLDNPSNEPELRAAAAWGLAAISVDAESSGLLAYLDDSDELVAVHAIMGVSRVLKADNLESILLQIGDNDRHSAGLVRAVLLTQLPFVPQVVRLIGRSRRKQRQWLLYLLACHGRTACSEHVQNEAPELLEELDCFWTHHVENWTNRLDVADEIDFLRSQVAN